MVVILDKKLKQEIQDDVAKLEADIDLALLIDEPVKQNSNSKIESHKVESTAIDSTTPNHSNQKEVKEHDN